MNVIANTLIEPDDQSPEPFSVSAAVSLQERRYRTLKSGDTFGVFDHGGDILSVLGGADGLYHQDTRHLSRLDLALGGMRPLLLSSTLGTDNVMLTSDLSNAATTRSRRGRRWTRASSMCSARCSWEMARATGGLPSAISRSCRHRVRLELRFEADFADLFEVRGMHRERRGERLPAVLAGDSVTLSYRGLDGLLRTTRLAFEPAPQSADRR